MTVSDLDDAKAHRHRPLRISWTALGRWEECRQQEHLHRVGGLKVPSRDGRIFLPGTVADLSMRKWLELDPADRAVGTLPDVVPEILADRVSNPEKPIIWRGGEEADKAQITNDVQTALARLEPWLWENVLREDYDYEPEARGTGVVGIPHPDGTTHRVELFVAVDIAVRTSEGKYRLYDLKFTKNDQYVSGKTLGQLSFYKLGWAAMLKVPLRDVEFLSFLTPAATVLETPVYPSEDDLRVMTSRITQYAEGIWSGNYPTKEKKDSFCNYRCDVRRACPLFQIPVRNGKAPFRLAKKAQNEQGTA